MPYQKHALQLLEACSKSLKTLFNLPNYLSIHAYEHHALQLLEAYSKSLITSPFNCLLVHAYEPHALQLLEAYPNLGPIVDFCVVDLDRQGQGQVYSIR